MDGSNLLLFLQAYYQLRMIPHSKTTYLELAFKDALTTVDTSLPHKYSLETNRGMNLKNSEDRFKNKDAGKPNNTLNFDST